MTPQCVKDPNMLCPKIPGADCQGCDPWIIKRCKMMDRTVELSPLPKMSLEERIGKAIDNLDKALEKERKAKPFPLRLTNIEYMELQKTLLEKLLHSSTW